MIFDGGSVRSKKVYSPSHGLRHASPLREGARIFAWRSFAYRQKNTVTYVTAKHQYFKYRLSLSSARFRVRQTVLLFTPRSSAIWARVCSWK